MQVFLLLTKKNIHIPRMSHGQKNVHADIYFKRISDNFAVNNKPSLWCLLDYIYSYQREFITTLWTWWLTAQLGVKWDKWAIGWRLARGWLSALPWVGGGGVRMGNKRSSSPTPWPVSFFSSLNEGIRQTLSVRPQGLSRFQMDSRTAVRTQDKGMS